MTLLDGGHLHHRSATDRLARQSRSGCVPCPLKQNVCVRIFSLSAQLNRQSLQAVSSRLMAATTDRSHVFWPDSLSLLQAGCVRWDRVLGALHITEVDSTKIYLLALALALAAANQACPVRFDRFMPLAAVPAALPKDIVVRNA